MQEYPVKNGSRPGLDKRQCSNILSKVANDWDYVQVASSAGQYDSISVTPLGADAADLTAATPNTGLGILRTLKDPNKLTSTNCCGVAGSYQELQGDPLI